MIFDPMYFVFMIPGVILMLWAQSRVKGSYARYSKVRNDVNMTGAQVARRTVAKYREGMNIPSSVQRRREKQALARASGTVHMS